MLEGIRIDEEYTIKQLKEMIKIKSIVGEERDLAEYLGSELKSLGFKTEIHDVEPRRPNIYAKISGKSNGPRLMFNGHTDTVPVCEGWQTDPFTPVVKEGRIYGLGSCDMKAGFACALTALKAIIDSGTEFGGKLLFSGVIDEEAYSKGAKAMLKTDYGKCDAIILGEPYPGNETKPIPLGITGKILYDVTVKGHSAHGFTPQLGINAIEEAAKIIISLDKLKMKSHERFGVGNHCTLKIEGGYTIYSVVVPDRCRFEVNRLLVPGESANSAIDDFNELVKSLNLKSEVEVKTKPPQYEPFMLREDEQILKIFQKVYKNVLGVEPKYAYNTGITDANVFAGEARI
ncbi:ArgE/DapE family deacylase, partial [Candidatus Bathyarchaeota archaeon]|nr:ArgE/DapE family deacylase [Candidatus Bathyarchaeota archaeon]